MASKKVHLQLVQIFDQTPLGWFRTTFLSLFPRNYFCCVSVLLYLGCASQHGKYSLTSGSGRNRFQVSLQRLGLYLKMWTCLEISNIAWTLFLQDGRRLHFIFSTWSLSKYLCSLRSYIQKVHSIAKEHNPIVVKGFYWVTLGPCIHYRGRHKSSLSSVFGPFLMICISGWAIIILALMFQAYNILFLLMRYLLCQNKVIPNFVICVICCGVCALLHYGLLYQAKMGIVWVLKFPVPRQSL